MLARGRLAGDGRELEGQRRVRRHAGREEVREALERRRRGERGEDLVRAGRRTVKIESQG